MGNLRVLFLFFLLVSLSELQGRAADLLTDDPFAIDKMNGSSGSQTGDLEDLDLRKGVLSVELPLFSVPVAGQLKLDFAISFNKSSTISEDFIATEYEPIFVGGGSGVGGWQIEVPRIVAGRYADYVCGRSTGFVLVLPGEGTRQFVVNNSSDLYPGANFVSVDNWIARCKTMLVLDPYQVRRSGDGFWGDYTANGDFEIISPDGRIFNFERKAPIVIDGYSKTPNLQTLRVSSYEAVSMQQPGFYVDRVRDLFGNYIQYNFGSAGISRIVTSRGQAVYFGYGAFSSTVKSGPLSLSVTKSINYINSVTINNRKWLFDYSFCPSGYGVGCFDVDKVSYADAGSFGTLRRYVLRRLRDPMGQGYSFSYTNYIRPNKHDYYYSAVGRHFHLTGVTTPTALQTEYSFSPTCSYFFDGMPASFHLRLAEINSKLCVKSLSLNRLKRAGVSISRDYRYYYHVPNMVDLTTYTGEVWSALASSKPMPPAPGDPVSYTFVWDMTGKRLSSYKYRRDPGGGDLSKALDTNLFDTNMLLETSVFPAPSPEMADIALPSPLPTPPPVPPSLWVDSEKLVFDYKDPMQVKFYTSGRVVVTARCLIDGKIEVFCAPGSPILLPQLSRGAHTLSIIVGDAFQGYSSEQIIHIQVNQPLSAEELMLILNTILLND